MTFLYFKSLMAIYQSDQMINKQLEESKKASILHEEGW